MNSKVIALLIVMSFLALKFNSVQGMSQGDLLLLLLYKGNILSSVPDTGKKLVNLKQVLLLASGCGKLDKCYELGIRICLSFT